LIHDSQERTYSNGRKIRNLQRQGRQFRFRLKASNGENILASEGYKSKDSCKKGIASVQKNAADASRFEVTVTAGGKHRFNM